MKITDYPLLEEISPEDQFIVETDDGTKRASYSLVAGLKGLLDAVYPVGSLYLSYEDVSPAELFGGSWTQINGYFLRAANDTETGGADSISLTVAQMPSHSHIIGTVKLRDDSGNSGGQHITNFGTNHKGQNWYTGNSGESNSFNNMPKYQNIYVWRRVS